MKYLSKSMVIVLILLSSTLAIAQEDSPSAAPAAIVEPTGSPPKVPVGFNPQAALMGFEAEEGHLKPAIKNNALVRSDLNKIAKNINEFQKNTEDCKDREDKANTFCMESRNPDVKEYLGVAQLLMGTATGMAKACSQFAKVMDAGNKTLTAYQSLCGMWRGHCTSACGKATNNVKSIKKAVESIQKKTLSVAGELDKAPGSGGLNTVNANEYNAGVDKIVKEFLDRELQVDGENFKPVAKKLATCENYKYQMAASAVGMVGLVKSFGEANKCDENTSAIATNTEVDCTLAANKQNNMTCICKDAPRTPGCPGGLDNATTAKSAGSLRSASTSDYVPTKASGNAGVDGGNGEANLASKTEGGSGALPGAPVGGGAAGIDGGSGGGSGTGSSGGSRATGLNANILGSEGGGGGGGGRWGGGGSEGNSNGLRQYLPGGVKDPTALAGQAAATKEVTSQGGKSNWEKVRERYRDNKPSLLGY
jgi:hypothetical protein